ncbi:MAG: hypothetical protein WCY77_06185 [Weeksellaceae bacterium]
MNPNVPNTPQQDNDEVDLIRLLNYFKNGIKSVFRKLWKIIEAFIQFIILLKKNWILVIGLTVLGALYALLLRPILENKQSKTYEMIVQSNPVSNLELYAFSSEINNQDSSNSDVNAEGISLAKSLGITNMKVEAVERSEDVVNNYFNQIEVASLRGDQTDTLYYKAFEINNHKSKMDKSDFAFQKVRLKVNKDIPSSEIQEKLLNYLNNSPGIKLEQEAKLQVLTNYEYQMKRNVENIDSLLVSKAVSSKNAGPAGSDQLLVNTASRGTVEGDLLRYSEVFNRKLYSTQKMIASYQKGVNIISNIRAINEKSVVGNPILKYSLLGFGLALIIVLLLRFNKYLNRYEQQNNI